jgi:glycosyltransferase involved in cell wall biosynthesis
MQSGNTFDDFSFSIALVNYKTPEVTKLCLELLHKALDVNKVPVWVVDNDSKDDSLAYLKSLDWIKLIERTPVANEHGFMAHGRALDMILERVDTDYLLLLHTDTLIYDVTVIKRMLEQLSKNQKAAAIGCFEQVNRTRLQTMWRVAIRAVKYYFRRLKVALGISTRDPRLFYEVYLKSFCTLWNVGVIRQHQMSFAMVERIPGYEMQDRLRELGYDFLSIPPRQMFKYLDHIEAGTVAHVRGLAKNHKRVKNYQAIMNKTKKL